MMRQFLFFLIGSVGFSAFAGLEFDCVPVDYNQGVEGVQAFNEGVESRVIYYTPSSAWGAVDENISITGRIQNGSTVSYKSEDLELIVHKDQPVGDFSDTVHGVLKLASESKNVELMCEIP